MPTIAFIGAGSAVFARNLIGDILSFPELRESTILLFDIDPERLRDSERMAHLLAAHLGARPRIEATTVREQALEGADYVIAMFQVGGYRPATVTDFEIPRRFGLRQTIGDTIGIGGIMRGLRTIPVLLDMCRDMERLCPDATLLQYVNPMAMNCWAISRASRINAVGLCHSVQHTISELAYDLGLPEEEIDYLCAGINHMAFYLRLAHRGADLYPRLRQIVEENRAPAWNRVRYELFRRLGYFVTESSEHVSEYTPWFIKRDRPDLIERFNIPLDEYPARCERQIAEWEGMRPLLEHGDAAALARYEQETRERRLAEIAARDPHLAGYLRQRWARERQEGGAPSGEYGALIIHAMETGQPRVIYGNVANHGLIDNLPQGCCVEVPCLVDRNGVQPTRVGALPPQLAALMQTNINVQALTVEAALTGKREHIYHAAMLDPHTGAELDLEQIWALVDALIAAHGDWLPAYS
ncbi:MAG: alpha-glucosidase/alpha-galactosidase [Oscillochloridaceae bacterium]|nr:alpha-glucosidase/alpha-galactosidase [Chloroflexaceae bacterium]MDW8389048.1 alpha-glucosidase/alpha-galactosidase [Oscillochloridaceae bacterium]